MDRRKFISKGMTAGLVGAGAILTGCKIRFQSSETAAISASGTVFNWKMVTTWPPHFPVMGEGVELMAQWVKEMSGGRLNIHVYGAGELVGAFESFDAVSQGVAELGHGAAYYWAGKSPATQFFCAVPFGMNSQQMNAWLVSGGGLKLWEEVYDRFHLVPLLSGNTGMQMGGWFNKEILSIQDFRGLKMRIPGLGGKVISKVGGTAIVSPGSEIFTNLERGVIDATEWVGPYHDYLMGFHKIAKYYYYPGWHEPGPVLDTFVNKTAFNSLPNDLKEILRTACYRLNGWMTAEFDVKNQEYLHKIKTETSVDIRPFPMDVLRELKKQTDVTIQEIIDTDPISRQVYESFLKFKKDVNFWSDISERMYYEWE